MKLERVLKKAAPFLLIAIFIACLFSFTQKEGMKMKPMHPKTISPVKDLDTKSRLGRHTFTTPKSWTDGDNIITSGF